MGACEGCGQVYEAGKLDIPSCPLCPACRRERLGERTAGKPYREGGILDGGKKETERTETNPQPLPDWMGRAYEEYWRDN